MNKLISIATMATLFFSFFRPIDSSSCSMYKVTVGNKTMVGINYDAFSVLHWKVFLVYNKTPL
ncbi:MAG: hypothetical protein KA444_00695 [Bacteroidia bacterium]|nr:hypothetical protein [Bacteroidia bacterium]